MPSKDLHDDWDSSVIMKTSKEFIGCCLYGNAA